MCGYRETQPHPHPARIALDGRVQKLSNIRERDDLLQRGVDLVLPHSENRAVHVDVFTTGQLVMETRPDFEQRTDPSIDPHSSRRGMRDSREDLQERTLACAVAADDADYLALLNLE